ncbi:glycosyltransferase family 1 protein [Diplodia corticola]|uniref:Glycosyltransferase family 1 protein n=1 Tax=Diplodia corticola TaxID=236234 RepID=A0A1J9RQZ3_9PEZI|nr:glycosyltransferase family 1 protein [Diplodia corticola]OJD29965.1 glycosyltransferase family 1 protein [Diplodia corticola]
MSRPGVHPRRASAVTVLQDDGRVNIKVLGKLPFSLRSDHSLRKRWKAPRKKDRVQGRCDGEKVLQDFAHVPRMNIAILITGSRGDVQPFLALSKVLQSPPYCHRVRIVTHPNFKGFVEENGVEFYSMGGDPEKLMAYMVRNPSILPSMASVKAGDVRMRRREIAEMLYGAWRGCTEAGDGIEDSNDDDIPFVADAIIANPPSYAHIHIAEKLSVPLHIMFTMPWSPTTAFPHPLANVQSSKSSNKVANWTSYYEMDLLTWEGLSDLINRFRVRTLDLDPLSPIWGHQLFTRHEVPHTYCWSEALIPKPADWGPHISISGFFFLSLASSYTPPPELQAFLDAGPPPVYIGFGSIVVDDPQRLTEMVLEAVKKSGVRALVSRGWGKMGGSDVPDNVFLLGNVPHDWLFPRVSAVVHHGGAGTTAIGIALGKPTVIVPFFGDQPWWASMVYRAGAGPEAVHFKKLTADKLAHNITEALKPEMQVRAKELADKIRGERGAEKAAETFHSMPQMRGMACAICPDRVAVWKVRSTGIQLSAAATTILVGKGLIDPHDLKLCEHKRWYVEEGPPDPLAALVGTLVTWARGYQVILSDFKHDLSRSPYPTTHHRPPSSNGTPSPSASTAPTITTTASTASTTNPSPSALQLSTSLSHNPTNTHHHHHPLKPPTHTQQQKKPSSNPLPTALATLSSRLAQITLVRGPAALLYNVANGMHNAPSVLLRDPSVRGPRPRIDGVASGLRVGGREFACGLADAAAGFVVLPVWGWRDASAGGGRGRGRGDGPEAEARKRDRCVGVAKGFAQALGGAPFKVGAAVVGPVGYAAKGVERQIAGWLGEVERKKASGGRVLQLPEDVGSEDVKRKVRSACGKAGGHESVRWIVERRVLQGCWEMSRLREEMGGSVHEFAEEVIGKWQALDRGRRGSRAA